MATMSDHLPECHERGYLDGHKDGVLDERARIRKAIEALLYECFDVNSDPSDWLLREDVLDVIDNEEDK